MGVRNGVARPRNEEARQSGSDNGEIELARTREIGKDPKKIERERKLPTVEIQEGEVLECRHGHVNKGGGGEPKRHTKSE